MRITDEHLQGKVNIVNRALGFDPETNRYNTVGAVQLYGAYGSTGVHRVSNEHGGVSQLCGLGTKREVALFLDGMIQALRIVQES